MKFKKLDKVGFIADSFYSNVTGRVQTTYIRKVCIKRYFFHRIFVWERYYIVELHIDDDIDAVDVKEDQLVKL